MTPTPRPRSRPARAGFTLIEMLVVVAIIVILMALAVPSFVGTINSSRLTSAGQNMVGRLSQAQQTAASTNLPVEVRFYRFTDSSRVGGGDYFGAYQFLLVKTSITNGFTSEVLEPLSSPFYIESGVFISTGNVGGSPASPLLTGTGTALFTDGTGFGTSKQIQKGSGTATYAAIRFFPDGTVRRLQQAPSAQMPTVTIASLQSLNLPDAYLTLVGEKDLNSGSVANYYAVQLDPYTGHARSYQPGL